MNYFENSAVFYEINTLLYALKYEVDKMTTRRLYFDKFIKDRVFFYATGNYVINYVEYFYHVIRLETFADKRSVSYNIGIASFRYEHEIPEFLTFSHNIYFI